MDTIMNFIRTKQPKRYEKNEDIEDNLIIEEKPTEEIELKEPIQEPIQEPTEEEIKEIKEIIEEQIKEEEKPQPKPKRQLSEKKIKSLEKARFTRSENARRRRELLKAEKEEKEREISMRREAIMLEKLQPMINNAIENSLKQYKLKEQSKTENITTKKEKQEIKPQEIKPQEIKPQEIKPQKYNQQDEYYNEFENDEYYIEMKKKMGY